MKKTTLLTVASCFLATGIIGFAAQGCGDDDSGVTNKPDTGVTPETSTPDSGGGDTSTPGTNPPAPAIGTQIDRFGRPAINTALNHTFDTNDTTKGAAKDAYNQDSTIAGWKAAYIGQTSANLAILDSLDGTCGNGLFASPDAAGPATVTYGALGGVAADDRMWIKLDATTCSTYLAVEADATKFLPNADCGGRSLAFDVIDITYSAVAIGAVSGVSDGVAKDDTKTGGITFPFLSAPVQ